MHVLFLHKYTQKTAGYRYRFQQYIAALEKSGIRYTVSSLLDEHYLNTKFATGRASVLRVLPSYLKRIYIVLRAKRYDLVVFYSDLLPYFPPLLELYMHWRKIPYIYDYDDAIFFGYQGHSSRLVRWLFGNKISTAIRFARTVFAGNRYLADYARPFNSNIVPMPTVVDLKRYSRVKNFQEEKSEFIVGWIGSPSTTVYLEVMGAALEIFCKKHSSARVVLVGAGEAHPLKNFKIPVELRPWREHTELDDLLGFDVGVMPLTDDPWTRGKCGFKLIQYMACGLPVIASPVGVNVEIVTDRENGYLAKTTEEWVNALDNLLVDVELRKKMGHASRKGVEERYSLTATAGRFIDGLRSAQWK